MMNNSIENQMNFYVENSIIDDTSIDVTFLFFFSNFCKCLLFIVSMSFLTLCNLFFDYFWSWDFAFERLCWENDWKNLSCWKYYEKKIRSRYNRSRLFTTHFIKWNCDLWSQRRKKSAKWTKLFYEKKFEWRRTTTLWCFFVVVVVWRLEIKRSKKIWFFW